MEIADDGAGFRSETAAATDSLDNLGGNGIASMQRRAGEMNGRFIIESKIGGGTKIILRLPLDAAAQTGGENEQTL